VDSVFNVPLDHARAICETLVSRRVDARWSAWFSDTYMTDDFVDLALRAGCDHFIFSPDGFSNTVLDGLGKQMRTHDIRRTFNLLAEREGFEISYNFFKNPPGQGLRNLLPMVLFCLNARRRLGTRVHFEFSTLRIEPHTRLHDIALREGVVREDECLLFPKNYSQARTRYIEWLFDLVLRLKGQ
jgi:hypothetical protein